PFQGPIGAVRVGRVDGRFVLNPTFEEMEASDLDLVLAGHKDGVNMIEVGAHELTEEVMLEAISFGYDAIKQICNLIEELRTKVGKAREWTPPPVNEELNRVVREKVYAELRKRRQIAGKQERQNSIKELYDGV